MIQRANLFNNDEGDGFIRELNSDIEQLNSLINVYNSSSLANRAEELLQVHQQLLKLDANIGGLGLLVAISGGSLRYDQFYKGISGQIQDEFRALGCPGISSEQINQWDIENSRSDVSIPSALLFEKETQPGFLSNVFGGETSTEIKQATRLLQEINPKIIKDNTQENYNQLTNLKQSIRALFASETISTSDKTELSNLIAKINGRLANIIENNPQLKSKVYPPDSFNLAQQISNLSYQDAQALTRILENPRNFNADNFHKDFDPILPALTDYTIRFLGGENAKNYLITNNETGQQQVLKISPNKGNSRHTYERLKTTDARNGITDVPASHSSVMTDYMYTLELTEFCSKGDVLSHGIKVQDKINLIEKVIAGEQLEGEQASALERLYNEFSISDAISPENNQTILAQLKELQLLNTVNIYSQMTNVLLDFQANNAFFPDMKPTNFLVNEFEQVVIADTKSFVDTVDGIVNRDVIGKKAFLLYTPGFLSPQFEEDNTFSADKEHAYLMGLSLYCYITGIDIKKVPKNSADHPNFIDLSQEVFKSEKGQQFKTLIEGLTRADPEQRLGMEQAKQALHSIAHEIKIQKSPFKSKTEAYFYALHNLMEIGKTSDNPDVVQAIKEMKILIENHEQDPLKAADILNSLANKLENEDHQKLLGNIATAIQNSEYKQTAQEKYENPLARRLESEMQIALLKNPTDAMMSSVGHVSKALLNVFEQMEKQEYTDELTKFVSNLTSGKEQTGFGSQPEPMTLEQVKEILQKNDPKDLNQILFIQFLFAQKEMRQLPEAILPPNPNMPSGKLLELIKEYNDGEYKDSPQDFFNSFDADKLKFISDNRMYSSKLFTADPTRGRQGPLAKEFSSQMGVMLHGQNQEGLDVDRSRWTPDSKYQGANLDSPFTRDLIENDAVYAAGPSGMTSLFMGIMENYGNFPTIEEKQNYFAAVSAYMVSGGLHSLHEVLAPAQFALDLIPGYKVTPPSQHSRADPPNFHQFYQQQMDLDPQFKERYDQGWDNVMEAYARQANEFVHAPISDVSIVQQKVSDAGKPIETSPYKEKSEEQIQAILESKSTLKPVNFDAQLTSERVNKNRDAKELQINTWLMKINIYALKGDEAKLQDSIDSLLKTVCKTRTNIFKSYSTSTTSAEKLIENICASPKLKEVFGIMGSTPAEIKKEVKARMEAAYNNEAIATPDFSPRPGS